MKCFSFFSAICFVFLLSSSAFAVTTWTNKPTEDPTSGADEAVSQIVADFQTSSGVTLSADTDDIGSLYGVAAGHEVSGTRIYFSHSNNAQIEFTQLSTAEVTDAAIQAEATAQLAEAGFVADQQNQN